MVSPLRYTKSMKLYNFQQKKINKISFDTHISMYVCGVTPYDSAHLGHIFTFMTYDLLARYLRHMGHTTKIVRNITDVDEPIYAKAEQLGVDYKDLAEQEIVLFQSVMKKLNLSVDIEPKASDYIQQMSIEVQQLIDKGYGYRVQNGDIYFDVSKFSDHGAISTLSHELQLKLSAERGGDPTNPNKRNALDFLLWKMIEPSDYPGWTTDLGFGRPGWHIECSVMSQSNLELPITIHGGGLDLLFPHHASEIAQSEALENSFVSNWMYVAPLLYKGEKMSKSLGNLLFAKDILEQYEPQVLRLALMNFNYRVGGEWCEGLLEEMDQAWITIQNALKTQSSFDSSDHIKQFLSFAEHDLNMPRMLDSLLLLSAEILSNPSDDGEINEDLRSMISVCGLVN